MATNMKHTASAALKLLTFSIGDAPFVFDDPTLLRLKAGDQEAINGEWMLSSDRHYGLQQLPANTEPSRAISLRFHANMLTNPHNPYSEKQLFFGQLSYSSVSHIADITSRGGELVADPQALAYWVERLNRPY